MTNPRSEKAILFDVTDYPSFSVGYRSLSTDFPHIHYLFAGKLRRRNSFNPFHIKPLMHQKLFKGTVC